jgi:hypothetical protein
MAGGRRHHVVSRGYQRHWTNDGVHIELIRKSDLWSKPVSTNDAFVRAGFNAIRTDDGVNEQLEDQWARLEGFLLPIARYVIDGELSAAEPSIARALHSLIALHWVRSYSLHTLTSAAYLAGKAQAVDEWPALPRIQLAFRKQHGREPEPDEMEATIARIFTRRLESNRFFVEHMISLYNQALKKFSRLNIEVARVVGTRTSSSRATRRSCCLTGSASGRTRASDCSSRTSCSCR